MEQFFTYEYAKTVLVMTGYMALLMVDFMAIVYWIGKLVKWIIGKVKAWKNKKIEGTEPDVDASEKIKSE